MTKDLLKDEIDLTANYHSTRMQKEQVLQRLSDRGFRITKQRQILCEINMKEIEVRENC